MKYEPLQNFLRRQKYDSVPMTFAQIEQLIGAHLPPSARKHRPWWSNNPSNSVITHAWLNAGYRTAQVDMAGERLVFRKAVVGERKALTAAATPPGKLFGVLKGHIRIDSDEALMAPVGESWDAAHGQRS
ncbi:MAG: hypothetical protein CMF74_03430 [Maricaulis sp.]|jgi:hypothetical protein|nr:hypothetical protein [Maricaulis sp.]HAQ36444.1 hypothetical protein [Alphaproteobacteria bacterium]|tara:strand:+ start:49 stop:438 length:390 start_codon:yes stop_codon:yes gene_type:complete